MQRKTFKYRLYPTPPQARLLAQVLDVCRHWYNMCIEDRKLAWELEQRSVTKGQQEKTGIHYRRTFPKAQAVFSQTMQVVCDDVDKAYQAFFRRLKAGETPGYPRFKGYYHFDSFGFKQYGSGIKIDGRRLKIFGVGRVRVRWDRSIEGTIKTVRIRRTAGKWYACFSVELPDPTPLNPTGQQIGIDLNVENLLTDSMGNRRESPKYYRQAQRDLRLAQRAVQRKQQGSQNRRKAILRVQRLHEHIKNQRQDLLNKVAHDYTRAFDLIALEDLRITNMVRNRHLSKSILDAGWGYLRNRLTVKAANAGRQIVLVDPAYTSKTCSHCGQLFSDLTLADRWVTCDACGLSLARDHNAAINILKRATIGWDTSVPLNVAPLPAGSVRASVR
jgi:putative transposase